MDKYEISATEAAWRRREKHLKAIFTTVIILLVLLNAAVLSYTFLFGRCQCRSAPAPEPVLTTAPEAPEAQDPVPPADSEPPSPPEPSDPEPEPDPEPEQTDETVSSLLAEADRLAAGYDYEAAMSVLQSYGADYAGQPALASAMADYAQMQSALVRYSDVTTIPHIFFHSLIVDTDRAFDNDQDSDGYNLYMTTVYEFQRIIEEMYRRGFVLVSIHDMAYEDPDTGRFTAGDILLPPGKKPFVLSVDDVCYYEYMTDSDGDHIPDAGGDGFANRILIGSDGKPTCEYITADGQTVTGDYDVVPILDHFIEEHPDFSYRGAKGILAVTGYEGVLGYRTNPNWKEIMGEDAWNRTCADAKAVVQCLKDDGWEFASHGFGHPAYGQISLEALETDVRKWEEQVQPIVGDTDILIYPFGDDISGVEGYAGPKYDALMEAGFRYYCNVDSHEAWVQIHDHYMRQGRRNLDGYRLYWNPELLDDLFDAQAVLDPNRPLPVPEI